jgi:hypothetical protein
LLFYLEKVSKSKKNAYLEGMFYTWNSKTRQMSKIQWVQHITVSNTLLRPVICCVKQNTVFTLAFNIHLFNFPLSACCSLIILSLYMYLNPCCWTTYCYTNIVACSWCYTNIIACSWSYTNIIACSWCYTNIIACSWCYTNIITCSWCSVIIYQCCF